MSFIGRAGDKINLWINNTNPFISITSYIFFFSLYSALFLLSPLLVYYIARRINNEIFYFMIFLWLSMSLINLFGEYGNITDLSLLNINPLINSLSLSFFEAIFFTLTAAFYFIIYYIARRINNKIFYLLVLLLLFTLLIINLERLQRSDIPMWGRDGRADMIPSTVMFLFTMYMIYKDYASLR